MPVCAGATARATSPAGGPRRPGSPQPAAARLHGAARSASTMPCACRSTRAAFWCISVSSTSTHRRGCTRSRAHSLRSMRVSGFGLRWPNIAMSSIDSTASNRCSMRKRAQHAQRVRARRVGEHDLAARQARDRGEVVALSADARLQSRQAVRVVQEVRRLHAVVAHQPEQRGTVASPVLPAQRIGLVARESELALHELGHRRVDARHRRRTRVVQRVVEVE